MSIESLTDKELDELVEWIERYDGDVASAVGPVIADLRATRAEVERLRTALGLADNAALRLREQESGAATTPAV